MATVEKRTSSDSSSIQKDPVGLNQDAVLDVLDEGKTAWKRFLSGGAVEGNNTRRAMLSRHLIMIGESWRSL